MRTFRNGPNTGCGAGSPKGRDELDTKGRKALQAEGAVHANTPRQESTWFEPLGKMVVLLEHSGGEGMRHHKKAGATLYRVFQILARKVHFLCVPRKPLDHFNQGPYINIALYTFKTSLWRLGEEWIEGKSRETSEMATEAILDWCGVVMSEISVCLGACTHR